METLILLEDAQDSIYKYKDARKIRKQKLVQSREKIRG